MLCFFFFQAEDGIRDDLVTGVQTCALPILIYSDVWTDPVAAGRAADKSFSDLYVGTVTPTVSVLSTPKPSNAHCLPWDPLCRSTIHYPLHIEPVWKLPRQTFAADGGTMLTDHTCV